MEFSYNCHIDLFKKINLLKNISYSFVYIVYGATKDDLLHENLGKLNFFYQANTYLFKVNNRNIKKGVKYVQS